MIEMREVVRLREMRLRQSRVVREYGCTTGGRVRRISQRSSGGSVANLVLLQLNEDLGAEQ
jgi:hypothetical protein